MKELPNVTLICVDCYHYGAAVSAIQRSLKHIKPFAVKFLTDIDIEVEGIEVVKIPRISSKEEYSAFIVRELWIHFNTSHVLVIQHDGYVLDREAWDNEFLKYDYIGAPWLEVDGYNVGNGGFSLRSYTLQYFLGTNANIAVYHPEDAQTCRFYRPYLETKGIKFATVSVAEKFAFELRQPAQSTFGFHGFFHDKFMPIVQVRRWAAMGDVVAIEPLLHYYFKKGYRVVLDTHDQFFVLFQQHYFPIYHPQQIDQRIPRTYVNLDMAYESTPKRLHLESYYNFAGIKDGKIRRPKLNLNFDAKSKEYKLFPKYALIHIDNREQPHRNIYNVDWSILVRALKSDGYTPVQIGKNEHEEISGAVQFNCNTQELLLMACAGADLFIGIDSGVSNICVAFGVPSVIHFGSVNPEYIHPDLTNIYPIHMHDKRVCDTPFCWHESVTTTGQDCYINKENPPCTQFKTLPILETIVNIIDDDKKRVISKSN